MCNTLWSDPWVITRHAGLASIPGRPVPNFASRAQKAVAVWPWQIHCTAMAAVQCCRHHVARTGWGLPMRMRSREECGENGAALADPARTVRIPIGLLLLAAVGGRRGI